MLLLIISGPSGSGKTTLSKIILKKLKNGIILKYKNKTHLKKIEPNLIVFQLYTLKLPE